ncbi:MAG TPA: LysE family translocator [Candidatus Acidoferrum sp.]|nr:LysE family translocator [Candidatus Acidoferrum sp.]
MSVEFLAVTLVVVATPGTGVIFTLAAGLSRGARASLVAAFGCTLGIVPHMVAAMTGVTAILHASALAFEVVKYLGVAYIFYLAWTMWRDDHALELGGPGEARSATSVIRAGILVNLLNPKLTLFFVAFLPQFVQPNRPDTLLQMATLSGVFMLVTLVVFAIYGVLAATVRRRILERPRVLTGLRRSFAALLILLGLRLAVAER